MDVGESALSAVRALNRVWSDVGGPDLVREPPKWLLDGMRKVRPVVETGFENVLLARALLECGPGERAESFIEDALNGSWPRTSSELMEKWQVEKETLVEAFGAVRDEWIGNDLDSWVAANKMFPGVVDALNFAEAEVFIITTKQTRFAKLLLDSYGVRCIPEDRIFGYGMGSKISVLKKIIAMPESSGKTVVFVEDRYETLEAVSISMLGQPLELLLATWGYNTEKTRTTAADHPFISLLDLPTFVNKFQ